MNNKGFWKVLMVSLVMASAIGLLASGVKAQNISTQLQLMNGIGQQVGGTVVLDNFEYWNSPRDNGWEAYEPSYPIYGAGIGLGNLQTLVDFQEGSRVMDVYCNPSVFLPMGGNTYMPYTISKDADYRDASGVERKGIPGAFSTFSMQVRAPLSIEWFDTFRVIVRVRVQTGASASPTGLVPEGTGQDVPLGATSVGCPNTCTNVKFGIADIVFVPRETQVGCTPSNVLQRIYEMDPATTSGTLVGNIGLESSLYDTNGALIPNAQPTKIWVALGRQFQDSSWHMIMEDLQTIIGGVTSGGGSVFEVLSVTVRGNQYRMDNIMFTQPGASIANNNAPYLFRIGPAYGQLFNTTQSRFVFAEDIDYLWLLSDQAMLMKAQNDPDLKAQLSSLPAGCRLATRLQNIGQGPDYPFIEDAAGLTPAQAGFDATTASFVSPLPHVEDAAGNYQYDSSFDPTTATTVAAPAAGKQSPALFTGATPRPVLTFKFTVGDALGSVSSIGQPVPVVPGDTNGDGTVDALDINQGFMQSLPPVLPSMNVPMSAWVRNTGAAASNNPMYAMACAMVNSGFQTWPTIQILRPAVGQVLEDQIVTCRVEDGIAADMETFPISVVNYPVTNLPPLIEQLEDRFFPVGKVSTYQITATDPDWADMANGLTYRATLNGLPNYQYGPWMEQIINPISGTISITPQFECSMTCIVTVTDPRGAQAVGTFNIFCVDTGTWLNHPPAVLEIIESPQIVRAGDLIIISDLHMADPDLQSLFYSCNIGSVGQNGIWSFQSEYPGEYMVQITGYDINGGAVTQQFVLQVLPWWSY